MGHLWELCPILLEPTALNQHMQFLMNLDFLIDQTNVKALDRQVDPLWGQKMFNLDFQEQIRIDQFRILYNFQILLNNLSMPIAHSPIPRVYFR